MKKAIIIGSGFGGLGLAVRLQSRGYSVKMIEKNERVGGHASQFIKDGYTFDMGPSLITAPDIIQSVFKSAGKDMHEYLDLLPLNPFYRVYYHDGTFIDYTDNSDKMIEQMSKFNQSDAGNYNDFIENSRKIYDAVITDGLGATAFNKPSSLFKFLPRALKLKALNPAYKVASKYFKDFRHRFLFSFHPLFIGGNPFKVPAIYLMISYLEKKGGVWFTKGGMYSLVQAFERLFIEKGGEVLTNSPVTEIVIKEGKAKGVIAGGEFHDADLVISNADTIHTYKNLIKPENRKKWSEGKLKSSKISMSSFLLYLGVKKKYPQLLHHTLILSPRYRELVEDIFENKILPQDFSMYLHVPSRTDAKMAPEGGESIYVLVPVANNSSGINWSEKKREFANRIINYLESDFDMVGLRDNIEVEEVFTPDDFQNIRNSTLGSPWGIEPILTQSAYFRPHNKSEDISNLYLVGAGTHPGAGVPGVLLSAEATEKLIIQDFGEN
jgi:phytoene desaturase